MALSWIPAKPLAVLCVFFFVFFSQLEDLRLKEMLHNVAGGRVLELPCWRAKCLLFRGHGLIGRFSDII